MPYLIDGHNLIGQIPDISLNDPNDEAELVQRLQGFNARSRQKCIVVFDHGIPAGKSRMGSSGVRVYFTNPAERADDVIMRLIAKEKHPQDWTVVSSDNEVQSTARRRRMQIMTATAFAQLIRRKEPPPRPGLDTAEHIKLSEDEIAAWLREFGIDEPE